tara:strand:+ start:326 stop:547 length:222 start_codon:yes stop_codon:yes gene_type:complete
MKWQDKIYTLVLEADEESAEDQVSKNIKRLRELGALGSKKKVGPLSPEVQKLKTDTMNLITRGRLMKSPPKPK